MEDFWKAPHSLIMGDKRCQRGRCICMCGHAVSALAGHAQAIEVVTKPH